MRRKTKEQRKTADPGRPQAWGRVKPLTLRTYGTGFDVVCETLKACQLDAGRTARRVEGLQNFLLRWLSRF